MCPALSSLKPWGLMIAVRSSVWAAPLITREGLLDDLLLDFRVRLRSLRGLCRRKAQSYSQKNQQAGSKPGEVCSLHCVKSPFHWDSRGSGMLTSGCSYCKLFSTGRAGATHLTSVSARGNVRKVVLTVRRFFHACSFRVISAGHIGIEDLLRIVRIFTRTRSSMPVLAR